MMKSLNLKKLILKTKKKHKTGWIAINRDGSRVIFWGKSFRSVSKKVESKNISNVFLMPLTENYGGFVTSNEV